MAPPTLTSPAELGSAATGRGCDFAELMRQVRAAGLLQRRPGYYLTKIAVAGGLFVAAWAVFVVVGDCVGLSYGWWVDKHNRHHAHPNTEDKDPDMPILAANDRSDVLRRQVLTARNVRGSRLVDFALGGLNCQIEHHLFPSMPRPHLHRAQPLMRAFCLQHGIAYCETTLRRSYAQAIRHLHDVGRPPPA